MNPSLASLYGQLHAQPWLLDASAHAAILATIENGNTERAGLLDDLLKTRDRADAMAIADGVAEIPINGPMLRAPGVLERVLLGAVDTLAIGQKIAEATRRPDVRSILLSIDSPGGAVVGTPELAAQIREAKKRKPVVAFTAGMMASAAYWIGSQASTVIASPSASIGSIGVYVPWRDSSKMAESMGVKIGVVKNTGGTFKGMGFPGTSYTEEQMAHLQQRVDEIFAMFKGAVTSSRQRVRPDAMRGQTLLAESARAAGLIDAVDSHLNAWIKAHSLGSGGAVAIAGPVAESATPTTTAEAVAEFSRLTREGKSREAGQFYAKNRALMLSRYQPEPFKRTHQN